MFLLVAVIRYADRMEQGRSVQPILPINICTLYGAIWYHLWKSTTVIGNRFKMGISKKLQHAISNEDFMLLQAGDRKAFKKVYDTYYNFMHFICNRCGMATQNADEIIQDTFLKLFTKAREIKSAQQLKYWLATTCKNACIDQIRSQRKFASDSQSIIEDSEISDTTAESINRELVFRITSEFIEKIANEQGGETFAMFYRDGMSVKDIASKNGEATSTVTTRLTRMRRRFKGLLKEKFEDSHLSIDN